MATKPAETLARQGFAIAKEAILQDQQRNYGKALELYGQAVRFLESAKDREASEMGRDHLRLRISDYASRMSIIQTKGFAPPEVPTTPKDRGLAMARRAIYLDKVHEFAAALDAYMSALDLLETYLKSAPDGEVKKAMLDYVKRAEWLKGQLAANGLKDRLQFPYINKAGVKGSALVPINAKVEIFDSQARWQPGRALFDTGNGGTTLIQKHYADRLGLLTPEGLPVGVKNVRYSQVSGVVPGAAASIPLLSLCYRVRGAEIVANDVGVIDLPEDRVWDILVCLKEIGLLEKHGIKLSAQAPDDSDPQKAAIVKK